MQKHWLLGVATQLTLVSSLRLSMAVVPGTIIGNGRIGGMLFEANTKKDVVIGRNDNYLEKLFPSGPIYITTRNKDLDDIIKSTPKSRQEDLVFMQNGTKM